MVRHNRLLVPNGIYHVTCRRAEGNLLFHNEQDYTRIKTFWVEAQLKYNIEYLAYCLMSNHYHLLVVTPEGNLSQFMQWVNSRYSSYYNYTYDHDGHVFQGRYYCQLVNTDSYIMETSRYIHLNPVRAKITDCPEEYPYSSYQVYAGYEDWLPINTELVLQFFDDIASYGHFVKEGINEITVDKIIKAEQLIDEFVRDNGISRDELMNPLTKEQRLLRRQAVAMLAGQTTLNPKDIGKLTGINSPATLYRLLKK